MKMVHLIKLTVFFVVVSINIIFTQDVKSDLDALKKYLWIKKEFKLRNNKNLDEVKECLDYLKLILNEDASIYGDVNIEFYFKELNINFFKFISLGRTMEPYVSIIGIDDDNQIYEVHDPVDFINEILKRRPQLADSTNLMNLINIYNKISFIDKSVKFFDEYDGSILKTKLNYSFFNNIFKNDSYWCYTKLYEYRYNDFIDRYQITYCLSKDKFFVKQHLIFRN